MIYLNSVLLTVSYTLIQIVLCKKHDDRYINASKEFRLKMVELIIVN